MFSHRWDCSRWGQPSTAFTATPLKKGRLTSSWHPQDKTPLPMKRWEISTSQPFSCNLYSETSIDKTWWWPYKAETCCFTSNLKNIHLLYRCPRRNEQNFRRVFLMLNYTDITQNTYIQSWTVTEIMARDVWNFDSCYSLIDYQIHIETGRNMWFL